MNAPLPMPHTDHRRARIGLFCGLGAYAAWGVLPIYFKALAAVAPVADRRPPDCLVAAGARLAGDDPQGLARGARRAAQHQGAKHACADRDANRGELAALRLCDQLGAHPGRQPRLLSQSARQHPARAFLPARDAVAAAVDCGRDRRTWRRRACRGRARHAVAEPDSMLQLRHLRPAAQARRGRFGQRADGRNDDPRPARAGLSGL